MKLKRYQIMLVIFTLMISLLGMSHIAEAFPWWGFKPFAQKPYPEKLTIECFTEQTWDGNGNEISRECCVLLVPDNVDFPQMQECGPWTAHIEDSEVR